MDYAKGDILKVPRHICGITYYHFGVYVGNNEVVHFTNYGPDNDFIDDFSMSKAKVQKTSLSIFADKAPVSIDLGEKPLYSRAEIAKRAVNCIGDLLGEYNVVTMNCEHFANWCRTNNYKCNQSFTVLLQIATNIAAYLFLPKNLRYPYFAMRIL